VTREDDTHRVTVRVPQPHGRSQRVLVEECQAPIGRERLIRIFSVCGRADPAYYRRALELNSRLCHGALALQDIDGEPFFVMSNSFPRTTCDPEEIRSSIQEIARWADQVEAALATTDQY
jgi:serine/threonine-protein kinase